jgi:hypothetical protein
MKPRMIILIGALAGAVWIFLKVNAMKNNTTVSGEAGDLASQAGQLLARGLRNNNPGNIRHGNSNWQGQSATQTDTNFVQFATPESGIRALAKLLTGYRARGLDTIRKIITRYAPGNENDTEAYIASVAASTGIHEDVVLAFPSALPALVSAIIKHENGINPYTVATIESGVRSV